MTADAVPVLQIGAVLGDSDMESMAWSRAIGTISREAEVLSAGSDSPIRVNVIYHVDGRLAPNEFEGVRTGRFSKASSLLVVQAAVPAKVEDRRAVLLALLGDAAAEAERFAVRKKLAGGLPEILGLVRQLQGP